MSNEHTPKEIAQHYSAAMDSVNLIKDLKAKASLTEEDVNALQRNQEHLQLMLTRDFWTVEDLSPIEAAAVVL